jgi:hypothetical protein
MSNSVHAEAVDPYARADAFANSLVGRPKYYLKHLHGMRVLQHASKSKQQLSLSMSANGHLAQVRSLECKGHASATWRCHIQGRSEQSRFVEGMQAGRLEISEPTIR